MRVLAVAFCVVALCAPPASAQNGFWSRALGVDEARERGYQQGLRELRQLAEIEALNAQRELLYQQTKRMEAQWELNEQFKEILIVLWRTAGLSHAEAESITSGFVVVAHELPAMAGTVRRKGVEAAAQEIWAALDAYDYQFANQLLLAVQLAVLQEQHQN